MNNLNWDGLRFFIAAADCGSLSAAAKSVGSNQPTVGRHIDVLESQLGLKLFTRSVKGLTLTAGGVALLEHCRAIQSQIVKIERTVGGELEVGGSVRVALPEGLCLEVLIPQLPRLYAEYHGLRLELNVAASSADLTRGEADLAVRLFRPTEANLVVKHLGAMRMGLYASQAYIERFGSPQSVKELGRHRIIAYGDSLSALAENRWLLEQCTEESLVLCSDSTSTRLKATLCGIGISVLPKLFSQGNTQLVPLIADEMLVGHEMWLVYHSDLREVARVRAVADFITAVLGDTGS